MIKKLEHIGIAVKDLNKSAILFEKLLGIAPYKKEIVESEKVETLFFLLGDVKIELLAATNNESVIAKFIEKKGEGIHHLAFETSDINNEINTKNEEFEWINTTPKDGADNKKIAFLHPKSTNGVLVEMCMEKENNK